MNTRLLYLASAPFEAAARVTVLAPGHRARGLHGHGYLASVRAASADGAEGLAARLAAAVAPLDYSYLNDTLEVPTDENVARWIRARLADARIESIGIQSTRCLLYTSDAADERSSVDLGGRRIIKKKKRDTPKSDSISTSKKQTEYQASNKKKSAIENNTETHI